MTSITNEFTEEFDAYHTISNIYNTINNSSSFERGHLFIIFIVITVLFVAIVIGIISLELCYRYYDEIKGFKFNITNRNTDDSVVVSV